MKHCLLLFVAVFIAVAPCASEDQKDPYQHPHSHHAQKPPRKAHAATAGTKASQLPKSGTNVELAKLERQTAQIHSAPPKKTPEQTIRASKTAEKTGSSKPMNFSYHQPKERTATTASKPISRNNGRH